MSGPRIKKIAEGKSCNGVSWTISFTTKENHEYVWSGEYEMRDRFMNDRPGHFVDEEEISLRGEPKILFESLVQNGREIVDRRGEIIILNGQKTPKLSPTTSILSLLSREDIIEPASKAFTRILRSQSSDMARAYRFNRSLKIDTLSKEFNTLEKIQESVFDTQVKLALVNLCQPEIFQEISDRFLDIFPQVTEIKIESKRRDDLLPFFVDIPLLQIKERDITGWIDQDKISSGMLRTLFHIAEMYLWPVGTVIMIDEFENSLGVNCLDILTEDLFRHHGKLQFIITSHHPYVINNIKPNYWKLVQRKGGVVTASNADSLGLDASSHEAFIQLMNYDDYREGVEL